MATQEEFKRMLLAQRREFRNSAKKAGQMAAPYLAEQESSTLLAQGVEDLLRKMDPSIVFDEAEVPPTGGEAHAESASNIISAAMAAVLREKRQKVKKGYWLGIAFEAMRKSTKPEGTPEELARRALGLELVTDISTADLTLKLGYALRDALGSTKHKGRLFKNENKYVLREG